MSAVTQARYRECRQNAFRRVLSAWLAKVPPDGWEGSVSDLEYELWIITRREVVPTFIPRRNGLGRRIAAEQPFILSQGYTVKFRRTKSERTIRFTRRGGKSLNVRGVDRAASRVKTRGSFQRLGGGGCKDSRFPSRDRVAVSHEICAIPK